MLPHQKLDWTLSRLERQLDEAADDVAARTEYALACLSRAWFHQGGEVWYNKSLTQARRVLHHEPSHTRALVIAGASLVGMDRFEQAERYLDQALRAEPGDALCHLAMGDLHVRRGEQHQAVREFESACRQAPDAWEPHALLGVLLRERAEALGHPPRVLERSQYHLVRAAQVGPAGPWHGRILQELALACIQTGRLIDAHKLLTRLVDMPEHRQQARYQLGIVAMHMGKYKNAVLAFRQHLQEHGDNPHVHARIAACYLHLGEVGKAREACHRALATEPAHIEARWTLGCAWLEEGRPEDAVRLFKEILRDAPQHMPAFFELVRLRREARDGTWVSQALRAEVTLYDRLPLLAEGPGGTWIRPRETTRERIRVLSQALSEVIDDPVPELMDLLSLTTDEGLRARIWEGVLDALARAKTAEVARWMQDPGRWFGRESGHQALALARGLPDGALSRGLQLAEEDLQKAAVDRHGPARDVLTHRRRVEAERLQARSWQALLLLALGDRGGDVARNLLLRWAHEADPELACAARVGLTLAGDTFVASQVKEQARQAAQSTRFLALEASLVPAEDQGMPRAASDDEDHTCLTCGRRSAEVDHMMVRGEASLCDRCLGTIARRRQELATDDPRIRCVLTGKTLVDSREIYVYNGVAVAAEVVDKSLGLSEREEVDRFLAGW
jgi:tetratricopeptide (TPR) repeat protein